MAVMTARCLWAGVLAGCLFGLLLLSSCQASADGKWLKSRFGDVQIVRRYRENAVRNVSASMLFRHCETKKLAQFVQVAGSEGTISLVVVMDLDRAVIEMVEILQEQETPDYGGYIRESWFLDRYRGKSIHTHLKTVVMIDQAPDEIVAVTGATISSDAVTAAVNLCMDHYQDLLKVYGGDLEP